MGKQQQDFAWHSLNAKTVLKQLDSDQQGLSSRQAADRLEEYGDNRVPAAVGKSWFVRFFLQFHNTLIYVLLISAAITALLHHWVDTSVIVAVVLINAIVGLLQEGKAERALDAIRKMLALKASVIRSGQRITIDAQHLVPGDIVILEAGDKVPADLRLIIANNLKIEEAILTGESLGVEKLTEAVEEKAVLGDRCCMAYSGTTITRGQGQGVVVATGKHTEVGRISGMLSEVKTLTTPLIEQMDTFAKWLSFVIVMIASLIFAIGYWLLGYEFSELFMAVVGLTVAAIPEGLPAVLTITLAVGVQAMAKKNAIVRQLPAIETLGSVSVICTDKTGTLTRNEMSVVAVCTSDNNYDVSGDGYLPIGTISNHSRSVKIETEQQLTVIGLASLLCNDSQLKREGNTWSVEGDPMEGALLTFAGKIGFDLETSRKEWARTDLIPFDASHRFMATLNHDHQGNAAIYVKGAPEKIIELCTKQVSEQSQEKKIDQPYWQTKAAELASKGQRVIALAIKRVPVEYTILKQHDLDQDLVLLGLVGLMDPPRSEVIEAIQECYSAGIDVKMITGDHALTASSIGAKIGLHNNQRVLTGAELDLMNDDELEQAVKEVDIFARTSPEHKLRLVTALQASGLVVEIGRAHV